MEKRVCGVGDVGRQIEVHDWRERSKEWRKEGIAYRSI